MKKHLFSFLLALFFVFSVSAQNKEARKIIEFGDEHCSQILNFGLYVYQEVKQMPESKLYVIYYEGKHITSAVWNNKLKKYDLVYSNPKRNDAVYRAREIELLFQDLKFPKDDLVLVNGGFREKFIIEFWVVPKDVESPKPTPTLEEKEMKFRKGKPSKHRLCARIYDAL